MRSDREGVGEKWPALGSRGLFFSCCQGASKTVRYHWPQRKGARVRLVGIFGMTNWRACWVFFYRQACAGGIGKEKRPASKGSGGRQRPKESHAAGAPLWRGKPAVDVIDLPIFFDPSLSMRWAPGRRLTRQPPAASVRFWHALFFLFCRAPNRHLSSWGTRSLSARRPACCASPETRALSSLPTLQRCLSGSVCCKGENKRKGKNKGRAHDRQAI